MRHSRGCGMFAHTPGLFSRRSVLMVSWHKAYAATAAPSLTLSAESMHEVVGPDPGGTFVFMFAVHITVLPQTRSLLEPFRPSF